MIDVIDVWLVAESDAMHAEIEQRLAEQVEESAMGTRFGIYKPKYDEWWCGGHRWARTAAPACWFESERAAELTALLELPDQRGEWVAKPVPESAMDRSLRTK